MRPYLPTDAWFWQNVYYAGQPEIPGLVKLAAGEIYATKPTDNVVRVSFIEIYNECVYDLMRKEANIRETGLSLREDEKAKVHVANLQVRSAATLDQFLELDEKACENRGVVRNTNANAQSSRSHFVTTIENVSDRAKGIVNLIVLAGSECNKTSGNTTIRLKESQDSQPSWRLTPSSDATIK